MTEKPYHCRVNCPIIQGEFRRNCKGVTRTAHHLAELAIRSTSAVLRDGTRVVAGIDTKGEVVTPVCATRTDGELSEYACSNTGIAQAVELATADMETMRHISESSQ